MPKREYPKNPLRLKKRLSEPTLERQKPTPPEEPEQQDIISTTIENIEIDPLPKQSGRFYSGITHEYYNSETEMHNNENKVLNIRHPQNGKNTLPRQTTRLPPELKARIKEAYFKKHGFDPRKHDETEFIEHVIKQEKKQRGLNPKEEAHLRKTLTG